MPKLLQSRRSDPQPVSLADVTSLLISKKNVPNEEIVNGIIAENDKLVDMEKSDANYDIILTNTLQIADMLRKDSNFNASLTLLQWCISLCNRFTQPLPKLKEIRECARAVWACAFAIKKKKKILKPDIACRVTSMLHLLLKNVRKTKTEDVKVLALTEAWCSYFKAACYHYAARNPAVHKYTQSAVALMKDVFHEEYTRYRVVGLNHAISAASFEDIKGYKSAIAEYQKAVQAFKSAEDMNDLFRKSCINHGKSKLSILYQQLFFSSLTFKK